MPRWLRITLVVFTVLAVVAFSALSAISLVAGALVTDTDTFVLSGQNMQPTLTAGERVLSIHGTSSDAGTIVTFDDPTGTYPALVSRIIAVGGESIEFRDGIVVVDGQELDEPYLNDVRTDPGSVSPPAKIPDDYVWVMGDNRPVSGDSRFFGPIPVSSIRGGVTLVYWPPSAFRKLDTR
ncbi:MAG: signal peptidase I [Actinobacteria bacterium]|nr:signal peptidase I [Actinomycetota bacterium]